MAYVRFPLRFLPAITILALAPAIAVCSAPLPQPQLRVTRTASASKQVDINTASIDQLMKVPGMTRAWASRIIRFRPYRGKNELLERGVVNAEIYARIKDHIVAHRIHN